MKKLLLMCLAVTALTACSSDESSSPVVTPPVENENPSLIGVWKDKAYKAVSGQDEWVPAECVGANYLFVYTFNSDGTFTADQICEDFSMEIDYSGTYTLQGDVMTLTSSNGTATYKYSFEGNTILHMHYFTMENGERFYSTLMNKLEKQ